MCDLGTLRRLKEEEKKIVEALELMKKQLSALKVEEFDLKSRIHDRDIDKEKEEITQSIAPVEKSTEVNDTELNLSVNAANILNMLASGGKEVSEEEDEDPELEDEPEEMEEDPLVTFLNY